MTADEARGQVTAAREGLSRAMRELSVPNVGWDGASDALISVIQTCEGLREEILRDAR